MPPNTTPRAPAHLSTARRALWRKVITDYGLADEPHALELLRLALEALDRTERARATLAEEGEYFTDRFGAPKAHPAIAIERDSRLAAARLFRELGLDGLEDPDDARPPRGR